jgi:hypothetical protein
MESTSRTSTGDLARRVLTFRAGSDRAIEPARRKEEGQVSKKTTSNEGRMTQPKTSAKRDVVRKPKASAGSRRTAEGKPRRGRAVEISQSQAKDSRTAVGWRDTAASYASLGLAKGLRAAAATIGLARSKTPKRKPKA